VTLSGDRLDLEAIKVNAPTEEISDENLRSGDEQRVAWLFDLAALVDALFAHYLELRLSREFEKATLPAMRDWIVSRARARARAAAQ
jgi:hypothetical protein